MIRAPPPSPVAAPLPDAPVVLLIVLYTHKYSCCAAPPSRKRLIRGAGRRIFSGLPGKSEGKGNFSEPFLNFVSVCVCVLACVSLYTCCDGSIVQIIALAFEIKAPKCVDKLADIAGKVHALINGGGDRTEPEAKAANAVCIGINWVTEVIKRSAGTPGL